MYLCAFCNEGFQTRQLLHIHKAREHRYMYGGADLQASPFPAGVNPFEGYPDADILEEVYSDNEMYILHHHQLQDPNNLIFNFPLAGSVNDDDITQHMRYIFEHQSTENAYKLEIAAGVIIRHSETGQVRYFRPESNVFLLDGPVVVTNRATLQDATDILILSNLDEKIRGFRPDTKYVVQMITQLNYYVWPTNYPLGSYADIIPNHIANNRSIVTMSKSIAEGGYAKCCIFFALSQFLHPEVAPRNHKMNVRKLLAQWVKFAKGKGVMAKSQSVTPHNFGGLDWELLPLFEECFKLDVVIMEYAIDTTVSTKYIAAKPKYEKTLYLNVHNAHLSLIRNIHRYTHRYQCHHCKRLFPQLYLVKRHQTSCKKMSRLKFPSGTFVYFKTVFEELSHVGIVVPDEKRMCPWFCVFDFESLLVQTAEQTAGGVTRFTSIHTPVSVSVCSNVPGFTDPHFIVGDNPRRIVFDMMHYCEKVRLEVVAMAYNRWGTYLEQLKAKLHERHAAVANRFSQLSPPPTCLLSLSEEEREQYCHEEANYYEKKKKCVASDPMLHMLLRLYKRLVLYMYQMVILGFNSQKYDLKLIAGYLIEYMLGSDGATD